MYTSIRLEQSRNPLSIYNTEPLLKKSLFRKPTERYKWEPAHYRAESKMLSEKVVVPALIIFYLTF